MAYQIKKRSEHKIALTALDESGETYVVVKEATGKDELRLQEITNEREMIYNLGGDGRVSEKLSTPDYVANARKAWLSIVECNILNSDNERHFVAGDEWSLFLTKWGELGTFEQEAILAVVFDVNPHWGN